MNPPDNLPRVEADLVEWSVYADHLQTIGDRRGELIALDLAMSSTPDRDTLHAFHAVTRDRLRPNEAMPIAWCVAHARTLALCGRPKGKSPLPDAPTANAIGNATEFLKRPIGSLIEEVAITFDGENRPHWKRLLEALPPTCTRIVLDSLQVGYEPVLDVIPDRIREIAIAPNYSPRSGVGESNIRTLIGGRFDVVDATHNFLFPSERAAVDEHAKGVVVRVAAVYDRPQAHCVFGNPGDAALCDEGRRTAHVLSRWSWQMLQKRCGIIGVRAQLAGRLLEVYPPGLVRRGARWTYEGRDIVDGERIESVVAPYVFVARDVDRRVRKLLA